MHPAPSLTWKLASFEYRGKPLRYAQIQRSTSQDLPPCTEPLLFQHGLGADCLQSIQALSPLGDLGVEVFALDCPGHGESDLQVLEPGNASFSQYAECCQAFMDHMRWETLNMGGISMGAGITLAVANRLRTMGQASRLKSMILVRPAWLDRTQPAHLAIIARIGRWITDGDIEYAEHRLLRDPWFQGLQMENPLCASSVAALLSRPHAVAHAPALESMVSSRPFERMTDLHGLALPTLILVNDHDPLHPPIIGEALFRALPHAKLQRIAPRYLQINHHHVELNQAIANFLRLEAR